MILGTIMIVMFLPGIFKEFDLGKGVVESEIHQQQSTTKNDKRRQFRKTHSMISIKDGNIVRPVHHQTRADGGNLISFIVHLHVMKHTAEKIFGVA